MDFLLSNYRGLRDSKYITIGAGRAGCKEPSWRNLHSNLERIGDVVTCPSIMAPTTGSNHQRPVAHEATFAFLSNQWILSSAWKLISS